MTTTQVMPKADPPNLLHLLDDHKLKAIRRSLIIFFKRQEDVYDAEELAAETINRVIIKIASGEKIIFEKDKEGAYFYGVAKHILQEYRRERQKFSSIEDLPQNQQPIVDPQKLEQHLIQEAMLECLLRCISKLPEEDRKLILEYYRGDTGRKALDNKAKDVRKALADSFGVSLNALKVRVSRIRSRLLGDLNECLKKSMG